MRYVKAWPVFMMAAASNGAHEVPVSFELSSFGVTDPGLVRNHNQDYVYVDPSIGLFIVLDGMAGPGSATTAQIAGEAIVEVVRRGIRHGEPARLLTRACQRASACVQLEIERNRSMRGMGTSVVVVLMTSGRQAYVGHIGNSRAYLLREQRLHRLTTDHTVFEELVNFGVAVQEALRHPHASRLSRDLGGHNGAVVDMQHLQLREGDRLLLCSDGLNGFAAHDAIEQAVARARSASCAAHELVELAKRGGGGDNVSAIVVEIGEQSRLLQRGQPSEGAAAWWLRHPLFVETCWRMGLSNSPLASGLDESQAIDLLAYQACQALFHDLERTSGEHVWRYIDALVRPWFDNGGDATAALHYFDILRAASLAVIRDISRQDADLAVCVEIAVLRVLLVGQMVMGGKLTEMTVVHQGPGATSNSPWLR